MTKDRLYLLEDSDDVRELLLDELNEPFQVLGFSSATECLEKLEENGLPDLFISDFKMPKMDGLQFTQCLKDKGIDTPVIILSGAADKNMAIKALEIGVFSVIEKPHNSFELVSMARRAIAQSRSLKLNEEIIEKFSTFIRYVDQWFETSSEQIKSHSRGQISGNTAKKISPNN